MTSGVLSPLPTFRGSTIPQFQWSLTFSICFQSFVMGSDAERPARASCTLSYYFVSIIYGLNVAVHILISNLEDVWINSITWFYFRTLVCFCCISSMYRLLLLTLLSTKVKQSTVGLMLISIIKTVHLLSLYTLKT